MDLKETDTGVNPAEHWYYQHKAQCVTQAVTAHANKTSTIVDVGAGSGFFAEQVMRELGEETVATCVDIHYTDEDLQETTPLITKMRNKPDTEHDIYLMIDVLEHVADDKALLNEYIAQAAQDALFVITVPAFQWLWSSHDVYLEHYRRYTLPDLKEIVSHAGLEILEAKYIFASVLPLAYLAKLKSKKTPSSRMRKHGKFLSHIATFILALEEKLPANHIGGVSVFIVARKN